MMMITKEKKLPILHSPLVFNRSLSDSLSKIMLQLLRSNLVVLSGSRGSGKSTFATKTLTQYLQNEQIEGKNGKIWHTVVTAPFADPITNLAKSLISDKNFLGEPNNDLNDIIRTLREDPNALTRLCEKAQQKNGKLNLLLVVDQKEELYRYQNILRELKREGDDSKYIDLLLKAAQNNNEDIAIYLVFVSSSTNADYYSKYPGLQDTINKFQIELPPLSSKEIREILNTYRYEDPWMNDHDNPPSENHDFFKWLAQPEQDKFVTRLLKDFDGLNNGNFASQKLNTFLCWCVEAYTKNPGAGIMAIYDNLGPMDRIIHRLIEEKVWTTLSPQQKIHTERLVKALTVPTSVKYRPLRWENLKKLVDRDDAPFTVNDAKKIIKSFNATQTNFFLPYEWDDAWPDEVVDISTHVLISDWDMPQKWITEEQKHADIYRDLVQESFTFFQKKQEKEDLNKSSTGNPQRESLGVVLKEWWNDIYPPQQAPTGALTASKSLFYEGTSLANALEWTREQNPNAHWAARYDLSPNDPQYIKRRAELPPALQKKSDWDLALDFLHLSAEQNDIKRKQEYLTRAKEISLQRKSVIAVAVASVACVAALTFWYRDYQSNKTAKMVDFVELLEANGCLNFSDTERFDSMFVHYQQVSKQHLNDQQQVLEYLVEAGALLVDPTNPINKEITFKALRNMEVLAAEQITSDANGQPTFKNMLDICAEAEQYPQYQFPGVYYALLAHQNALLHQFKKTDTIPKAAIEESALASNPAILREYAYGDKNGRVFIANEHGTYPLPHLNKVINCVNYSPDGQRLYLGTEDGKVFYCDINQYKRGVDLNNIIYTEVAVKVMEDQPVYFVDEWQKDMLLISTTDKVYFLRQNGGLFEILGNRKTTGNSKRIGFTDVFDHRWFFAAGQDETVIFRVDPSNPNAPTGLEEVARIRHIGITITNLAAKMENNSLWLALGSEQGDIWLAANKNLDLLEFGRDLNDPAWFEHYPNAHKSSVTGLDFNEGKPQMASAGRDGYVYLWNLEKPAAKFDRIRLRNRGEGISAITYINSDELVAYESIDHWVLKTNITALKNKLTDIFTLQAKK
jgi:hypothetical protein